MRPFTTHLHVLHNAGLILAFSALLAPRSLAAQHEGHAGHSPYAGTGSAEVPTLTPEEIAQLRAGEGMGLARPAELNGYPGPRHALDLADSLALSPDQQVRATEIFETMHADAVRLGEEVIAAEKALSDGFAAGKAPADLRPLVAELARLRGDLRWVHLRAHLELASVLTLHQRHEYDRLRGYGSGRGGHVHGGDARPPSSRRR
jgi:hypothetical protein